MFELKLPGAGEGAKEDPLGPYDIVVLDSVLLPLMVDGCVPSRSVLLLVLTVLSEAGCCVYNVF